MPCSRRRRRRAAHSGSRVTIMPPSPVVMILRGWNENTARPAPAPTGAPSRVLPRAHAASSTTAMPSGSQRSWIGPMAAGTPAWWTTTTARVRSVSADSMVLGVRFCVTSSTSAKIGRAPASSTVLAVAMNESDGTTTSSPGPTPSRCRARCSPAVQLDSATPSAVPTMPARRCSNSRTLGPCAIQPDSRTAVTAASSPSPSHGRMTGIVMTPSPWRAEEPSATTRRGRPGRPRG
jgi:hypothetical protein